MHTDLIQYHRTRISDLAEKQYGKFATGDTKANSWTLLDFGTFNTSLIKIAEREIEFNNVFLCYLQVIQWCIYFFPNKENFTIWKSFMLMQLPQSCLLKTNKILVAEKMVVLTRCDVAASREKVIWPIVWEQSVDQRAVGGILTGCILV